MDFSPPSGATYGNKVTFYAGGRLLYYDLVEAIKNARRRVWLETFIIEPDEVGRHLIDLAADAARRGCDVVLLFDQLGSISMNAGHYQPILDAGGQVAIFNPMPGWRRFGRRLRSFVRYRDHRKIYIVDHIAFCGSHNLSAEYLGASARFHDISVRLEGPCVGEMAAVFMDSYRVATGVRRPAPRETLGSAGDTIVWTYAYDSRRNEQRLDGAIEKVLSSARESCRIILAYFVPDTWLEELLIACARKGLSVEVLTAGDIDLPFVRWAGQSKYDRLLEAGISIHQVEGIQLHAKCITVDGRLSFVGSYDVNVYQRDENMEVCVLIDDKSIAEHLEKEFNLNRARARPISVRDRQEQGTLMRAVEHLSFKLMSL